MCCVRACVRVCESSRMAGPSRASEVRREVAVVAVDGVGTL